MAVTTFNISPALTTKLADLQEHYGASSKAEIIRKAIALLDFAKDSEHSDGTIVITQANDEQVKLKMR